MLMLLFCLSSKYTFVKATTAPEAAARLAGQVISKIIIVILHQSCLIYTGYRSVTE